MPRSIDFMRGAVLTLTLVSLAGCSEYLARRDSISPLGGNTVEGDKLVQMVDPWPRGSANRDIAYSGIEMENAMERYKTGRVIPPQGTTTSGSYTAAAAQNSNNTTPLGPTVNQPVSKQ
jgi:hypothetical protein